MEIVNLKEFYTKEENESKDISLYLKYLRNIKNELKERLEDVLALDLSDNIAADIRKQISFVEGLESIIKNSYNDLMVLSVANLSDDELNSIGQKYLDVELKKQKEIEKQLELKKREKELDETANRESFYKHGYDEKFYQAEDTDIFFMNLMPARDYIKYLIISDMSREELDELFSLIFISNYDYYTLSETIVKLNKIVKITKSKESLDEVVDSFLSMKGMAKILNFESVDECIKVLEDLQKKVKLNTKFFKGLPDNLRENIEDEDFDVEGVYGSLFKIYEEFKKNGTITMPEGAYSKSFYKSIEDLENKLAEEQKRINDLEKLISNRLEFVKFIQSELRNCEDDLLSFAQIIKNKDEHDDVRDDLSQKVQNLENKKVELNSIISDINKVLENNSDDDFEIIKARNSIRMMNILGAEATEESIYPYFEAETRRLKQYKIIVDTIKRLNEIKQQIDVIDGSRNIIKNISGTNKNAKNKLLAEYNEICQDCYTNLDKEGLLRIVISKSYFDKESEILDKPLNFEELFNSTIAPEYTLTYQSYEEFKNRNCVSAPCTFEELKKIFNETHVLGLNLFTAKKRSDGVFEFFLYSDDYLDRAISSQDIIAHIYSRLYSSRKEERENLISKSQQSLSKPMENLMRTLNIGEGMASRDALSEYKAKLERDLDETNEMIERLNSSLDQNEKRIDGISMEDVEAYYSLLEGFYETVISTEKINLKKLNVL